MKKIIAFLIAVSAVFAATAQSLSVAEAIAAIKGNTYAGEQITGSISDSQWSKLREVLLKTSLIDVVLDLSGTDITKVPSAAFSKSAPKQTHVEGGKVTEQLYSGSDSLVKVILPETVTTLEKNAFAGCTALKSVVLPSSLTTIRSRAFDSTGLTSIELPAGITIIEGSTFYRCDNLETVIINEGVESIGEFAFDKCTSLKNIELPESLKIIDKWAFSDCENLETVVIKNGLQEIGYGAFLNCHNLTNIELPDTLTTFGEGAFQETGLQSVKLPAGLTITGENTFWGCPNLANVEMPDTLVTIARGTFNRCTSLTNVTIPASVNKIGTWVFYKSGITTITIPASVTEIACSAFIDAENLQSITFEDSTSEWGCYKGKKLIKTITVADAAANTATFKDSTLTDYVWKKISK